MDIISQSTHCYFRFATYYTLNEVQLIDKQLETRKNFENMSEEDVGGGVQFAASDMANTAASLRKLLLQLVKPGGSFFSPPSEEEKDPFKHSPDKDDRNNHGLIGAHEQRGLQSSCDVGDPVTVTSSAFPSMEGCLSDLGNVMDDKVVYESSTAALASMGPSSSTTTAPSVSILLLVNEGRTLL